jgi:hypothetical protein
MASRVVILAYYPSSVPVQAPSVSRLLDEGNLLADTSFNALILVIALLMESISRWW